VKIAIDRIKIAERIRKEITRIPGLAADILQNGLLHPVTVMPLDGGTFQLLAGLRRIKAAQALGWAEIECNIVSPANAEAALRIAIGENEQREPFTYSEKMDYARLIEEIERAKARERMLAGKKSKTADPVAHGPQGLGKSRDVIGEKIGMSGRQYDRAKYIAANAPQEVIAQLDKGERSIRGTYNELRAKEKTGTAPKRPRAASPMDYLSEQDKEAIRKLREFDALPPEGKIAELRRQLKEERARAATAESELAQLRERYQNDMGHKDSIIESLKRQTAELSDKLAAVAAQIAELQKGG